MKKGFFFVITIFLVLAYVLTSVSIWVKTTNELERQYSEKLRASNVDYILVGVSEEYMAQLVDQMAFYSLFKLDLYVGEGNPVNAGPDDNENIYIEKVMLNLMVNGSAEGSYFANGNGLEMDTKNFSLYTFIDSMNESLKTLGVEITTYRVSNDFPIVQKDFKSLEYTLSFDLVFTDLSNSLQIKKNYVITRPVSFEGFADPLILNEGRKLDNPMTIEKFHYYNLDYNSMDDLKPTEIAIDRLSTQGQSWFYGPVVFADRANTIPADKRRMYLLAGTYDEIMSMDDAEYREFGAYVLTNEPEEIDIGCGELKQQMDTFNPLTRKEDGAACEPQISGEVLDASFAVIPDFSLADLNGENFQCLDNELCVLFANKYNADDIKADPLKKLEANTVVYGIEKLRDFALCGYFIHNSDSPSYLQRLLVDGYSKKSADFGVETFLFGKSVYASDPSADVYGKIDKEFMNLENGRTIKGMPGCKTPGLCEGNDIGRFSITQADLPDYGIMDQMTCEGGCR
ncbi:MAG: hypothetical protein ABII22_04220 [Candidatus Micrarchaeota archaeon]